MLTNEDLIQIPYDRQYTQAGVSFLLGEMTRPGCIHADADADELRQRVMTYGADLAFRRVLNEREVPYQLAEVAPFANPERVAAAFGGRRVQIVCRLISDREQIRQLKQDPSALLEAAAWLPDEETEETYTDEDIAVFVFLAGLVTRSMQDLERALEAGQPVSLCYPMPQDWASPSQWRPLLGLALKAEGEKPLPLSLGGLDRARTPLTRSLTLPPLRRFEAGNDLYSLDYIQAEALPEGVVGVSTVRFPEVLLIGQYQWINLWVYGIDLYFAGYLSRGDFDRHAKHDPEGQSSLGRLPEKSPWLPVSELKPLADLFARAHSWAEKKRR